MVQDGSIRQSAHLIGAVKAEIKENVDSEPRRPIYALLTAILAKIGLEAVFAMPLRPIWDPSVRVAGRDLV